MKEQLITFETAKLAKEKGFNIHYWERYTIYDKNGNIIKCRFDLNSKYLGKTFLGGNACFAPTQSLLQRWLREIHKISIELSSEEALEKGLQEALKLIKN